MKSPNEYVAVCQSSDLFLPSRFAANAYKCSQIEDENAVFIDLGPSESRRAGNKDLMMTAKEICADHPVSAVLFGDHRIRVDRVGLGRSYADRVVSPVK